MLTAVDYRNPVSDYQADAVEVAEAVRSGERRAADVLEESLARIERLNPALNAFVHLDADRAREVAADIDKQVAAGTDPGPLAGVPLGIKELESVEGWPATSASTAFKDRLAPASSINSTRLLAAGAVPVGLTASPEMGLLFFTNSILHGVTRNPWDLERTPGGSSGGAGAALAAGLVPLCTGSDMGGSVRLPAGWCGVVGVKGTYGRVPRGPGWIGGANMVHYGPLARSVRDAARYLDCVVGTDQRDPGSLPAPAVPFERAIVETDLAGLRVAIIDDNGTCASDPGVRAAVRAAADDLIAAAGLKLVEDASLNVGSMDSVGGALLFIDMDPSNTAEMIEVMTNLMNTEGAAPLFELAFGSGMSLESIGQAQQFRYDLNQSLATLFDDVDLLLMPTSPVPAFGAAGPVPTVVDGKEVGATAPAVFTAMFNASGNPVVSVPAGIVEGCPVGMQIVARRHEDALALAAAATLEQARPWPKLAPYAAG
jgi:Asp-tRNA(Asn)/Glu-tRNA(Gln) amidotransferase A subunit family amidase